MTNNHNSVAGTGTTAGGSVFAAKDSWQWILIAKGIGIFLVVVGHFNPSNAPVWWQEMVALIYTFHMPLFLALSGYLYVFGKQQWPALMQSKFKRLVYPFIFVAILFLLIKLSSQILAPMLGQSVTLEHPINANALLLLLTNPGKSYMPLLWFVHALFIMFAIFPLLRKVLGATWAVFILFVLLSIFVPTPWPGVNTIVTHFPFFIAGIWLRESGQLQLVHDRGWMRIALACIALFAAIYAFAPVLDSANNWHYPWLLVLGLLGMLAVIAISQRLDLTNWSIAKWAAGAGYFSMSIYLFHTLFESAVRVAAFQVAGIPAAMFVPVALLAIAVGMIVPLLLEKYVLRNIDFTRKYLLGLG